MTYVTRLLKKTTGEDNKKTEMYVSILARLLVSLTDHYRFMTANRTVRTGLTASAVISVWPCIMQHGHY